jgi:hypothetical protein
MQPPAIITELLHLGQFLASQFCIKGEHICSFRSPGLGAFSSPNPKDPGPSFPWLPRLLPSMKLVAILWSVCEVIWQVKQVPFLRSTKGPFFPVNSRPFPRSIHDPLYFYSATFTLYVTLYVSADIKRFVKTKFRIPFYCVWTDPNIEYCSLLPGYLCYFTETRSNYVIDACSRKHGTWTNNAGSGYRKKCPDPIIADLLGHVTILHKSLSGTFCSLHS